MILGALESRLFIRYCYDSDRVQAATVERLVRHLEVLLRALVESPERPIAELPLLTAAEHQLLMDWNATSIDYPRQRCLHELIEEQVARTPEAVAVVYEDQSLTFSELDRRANQLAHHLRALGVGPEVRVGVCLERSLELVVALLGVLKAGVAYVPLDPGYPADRLAYMLADAHASVLLSQAPLVDTLPAHAAQAV